MVYPATRVDSSFAVLRPAWISQQHDQIAFSDELIEFLIERDILIRLLAQQYDILKLLTAES